MKYKKIIIISLIAILCTVIYFLKDKKELYINENVLAVTLDSQKIDSLPERGKYKVDVNCINGLGRWLSKDWKLVVENIDDSVLCNLDFYTDTESLKDVVEKKSNNNINGYRYSGKTPNNYIWFNDELWRIIGSIPVKNENGITENMVKIIRNNYIPSIPSVMYTWDSENDVYELLNEYYYGKKSASDTSICSYISTSMYNNYYNYNCDYTNIGISSEDYYGTMIANVYWNTGESAWYKTTSNKVYSNEILTQTVKGKIGAMNASDYLYATESISYDMAFSSDLTVLQITSNNWIYNGDEYTITSSSTKDSFGERLNIYSGKLHHQMSTSNIRPVVYLDPSVYVVSGNGTEANPYQIAM